MTTGYITDVNKTQTQEADMIVPTDAMDERSGNVSSFIKLYN